MMKVLFFLPFFSPSWPFVIHSVRFDRILFHKYLFTLKPSLSMKILSINNFTTKLLSKLLGDLYIGVHLKGTDHCRLIVIIIVTK